MKKSKFNYFVQNEKGDTLVMNILTNKVLKIEKQYLSITKQIFKKELIDESYKWIEDVLIDKGIMVEDDFNENMYCGRQSEDTGRANLLPAKIRILRVLGRGV